MKKILISIALAAFSFSAFGQATTNTVKVSQLPAGTTPLGGTELVPIVQAGHTVQVNVGQLLNSATALANAAQAYATALAGTNIATQIVLSNAIVAAAAAAMNASSNALIATNITMYNFVVTTFNTAAAATAAVQSNLIGSSNVLFSALLATNAILLSDIAAIQTTAGSGIQNGSSGVLNTLTLTNLLLPSFEYADMNLATASTVFSTNLDCSRGNFFVVRCYGGAGSTTAQFGLINFHDGQQITLLVEVLSGSLNFTLQGATTYTGATAIGTAFTATAGNGQNWLMNWLVMKDYTKTNIICSGGKL